MTKGKGNSNAAGGPNAAKAECLRRRPNALREGRGSNPSRRDRLEPSLPPHCKHARVCTSRSSLDGPAHLWSAPLATASRLASASPAQSPTRRLHPCRHPSPTEPDCRRPTRPRPSRSIPMASHKHRAKPPAPV